MPMVLEQQLIAGLADQQLDCTRQQREKLLAFVALLTKWNKAYNLTAIRQPQQMLPLHILDSLSIATFLRGQSFIDVGTGPGLPGVPLAILFPERRFTLLDSNGKKIRFIFQAKNDLGLTNIIEVQQRVEEYRPRERFDGIISRAFTSLREMLVKCTHLNGKNGLFYAMKGQYPEQELRELPKNYKVVASRPLKVPGVNGDRHLIELASKVGNCEDRT